MAYTSAQANVTGERGTGAENLVYSIGYMKRHDAGVARAMSAASEGSVRKVRLVTLLQCSCLVFCWRHTAARRGTTS